MSRIHDFDEFLNSQKESEQKAFSERQKSLFAARKKYDNLIGEIFVLIREYHEKIILPRTPSFLVVKRQEDLQGNKSEPLALLYRANLVPRDFLPPAFDKTDLIQRVDYLMPNQITENDWHANVALQFTLRLENTPGDITETTVHAALKTWGHILTDKDTLLPHGTSIRHEVDKRTPYSHLTVSGKSFSEKTFIETVENILIVATPNVLDHRDIVWKR